MWDHIVSNGVLSILTQHYKPFYIYTECYLTTTTLMCYSNRAHTSDEV